MQRKMAKSLSLTKRRCLLFSLSPPLPVTLPALLSTLVPLDEELLACISFDSDERDGVAPNQEGRDVELSMCSPPHAALMHKPTQPLANCTVELHAPAHCIVCSSSPGTLLSCRCDLGATRQGVSRIYLSVFCHRTFQFKGTKSGVVNFADIRPNPSTPHKTKREDKLVFARMLKFRIAG